MKSAALPRFREQELRRYDGEAGRRAYIAYQGLVYDVTDSRLWRDGIHRTLHYAGQDLSTEGAAAPHGDWVFARMPVVGVLVDS